VREIKRFEKPIEKEVFAETGDVFLLRLKRTEFTRTNQSIYLYDLVHVVQLPLTIPLIIASYFENKFSYYFSLYSQIIRKLINKTTLAFEISLVCVLLRA